MVEKLAHIRKDLLKKRIKVPIGDFYYDGKKKLKHRWLEEDDSFQVFYKNGWMEAVSIDWEFIDQKKSNF